MIKINLNKYILFFCNLLSCITVSVAQTMAPMQATVSESTQSNKWSIGIGVGVTSLPSLQCTYRPNEHLAIRGEYNYLGYEYKNIPLELKKVNAALDLQTRMSRFVLMAHYMPFKSERWGILAGIAFFPSKTITGTLHLADTLFVSEAIITPEVLGTGQLRLGYATQFAPYLGITIGRPIPVHKNSWRLDVGAYYGGRFAVKALNIDSNVFLKENESNASVLERNFNRLSVYYRFIPDIKLSWTHVL